MHFIALLIRLWVHDIAQAQQPPPMSPEELISTEPTGITGEAPLDPPPADEQVLNRMAREVSQSLRCPVCQGQSVAASDSDAARAMKARVRELLGLGYTREQVLDYFADRYGESILLDPPSQGLGGLLWLAPFVLIGAGMVGVYGWSRSRASAVQPAPAPVGDPNTPPAPLKSYQDRLLAELEKEP